MSTLAEIEQAIERLPVEDREILEARLAARKFGLDALGEEEHRELLASLEESRKEGGRFTAGQIRAEIPSWLGR